MNRSDLDFDTLQQHGGTLSYDYDRYVPKCSSAKAVLILEDTTFLFLP